MKDSGLQAITELEGVLHSVKEARARNEHEFNLHFDSAMFEAITEQLDDLVAHINDEANNPYSVCREEA